jgi:hypothetical protein
MNFQSLNMNLTEWKKKQILIQHSTNGPKPTRGPTHADALSPHLPGPQAAMAWPSWPITARGCPTGAAAGT